MKKQFIRAIWNEIDFLLSRKIIEKQQILNVQVKKNSLFHMMTKICVFVTLVQEEKLFELSISIFFLYVSILKININNKVVETFLHFRFKSTILLCGTVMRGDNGNYSGLSGRSRNNTSNAMHQLLMNKRRLMIKISLK